MFEEQCCTKWKNRWIPFFILICQYWSLILAHSFIPLSKDKFFPEIIVRVLIHRAWHSADQAVDSCGSSPVCGLWLHLAQRHFQLTASSSSCLSWVLLLALALLSSPSSLVGPPAHLPVANPLSVLSAPWQGWSFYLFCIQLAAEVSVTGLYWWCCRIY